MPGNGTMSLTKVVSFSWSNVETSLRAFPNSRRLAQIPKIPCCSLGLRSLASSLVDRIMSKSVILLHLSSRSAKRSSLLNVYHLISSRHHEHAPIQMLGLVRIHCAADRHPVNTHDAGKVWRRMRRRGQGPEGARNLVGGPQECQKLA